MSWAPAHPKPYKASSWSQDSKTPTHLKDDQPDSSPQQARPKRASFNDSNWSEDPRSHLKDEQPSSPHHNSTSHNSGNPRSTSPPSTSKDQLKDVQTGSQLSSQNSPPPPKPTAFVQPRSMPPSSNSGNQPNGSNPDGQAGSQLPTQNSPPNPNTSLQPSPHSPKNNSAEPRYTSPPITSQAGQNGANLSSPPQIQPQHSQTQGQPQTYQNSGQLQPNQSAGQPQPYQTPGQPQPYQSAGQPQPHQTPGQPQAYQSSGPQQPYQTPGQPQNYPIQGQPQPYQNSGQLQPYQTPGQPQVYQTPRQPQPYQNYGQPQPYQTPGQPQAYQTPRQPYQNYGQPQPYQTPGQPQAYQNSGPPNTYQPSDQLQPYQNAGQPQPYQTPTQFYPAPPPPLPYQTYQTPSQPYQALPQPPPARNTTPKKYNASSWDQNSSHLKTSDLPISSSSPPSSSALCDPTQQNGPVQYNDNNNVSGSSYISPCQYLMDSSIQQPCQDSNNYYFGSSSGLTSCGSSFDNFQYHYSVGPCGELLPIITSSGASSSSKFTPGSGSSSSTGFASETSAGLGQQKNKKKQERKPKSKCSKCCSRFGGCLCGGNSFIIWILFFVAGGLLFHLIYIRGCGLQTLKFVDFLYTFNNKLMIGFLSTLGYFLYFFLICLCYLSCKTCCIPEDPKIICTCKEWKVFIHIAYGIALEVYLLLLIPPTKDENANLTILGLPRRDNSEDEEYKEDEKLQEDLNIKNVTETLVEISHGIHETLDCIWFCQLYALFVLFLGVITFVLFSLDRRNFRKKEKAKLAQRKLKKSLAPKKRKKTKKVNNSRRNVVFQN